MAAASADAVAKLVGVYDFTHPHGTFQVHLRPGGKFFAPQYQAKATWVVTEAGQLSIDWGKYGQYELQLIDPPTRAFKGSFVLNSNALLFLNLERWSWDSPFEDP